METTVDPATVKTRLDDNDRRLIARTRQLAGLTTTDEIVGYFTAAGDIQTALPHDRAEYNLDFWKPIASFELRM